MNLFAARKMNFCWEGDSWRFMVVKSAVRGEMPD